METRNMDLFYIKKERFEYETEEKLFLYNNHRYRLQKSCIEDEDGSYDIAMTEEEEFKLDDACNEVFDNIRTICRELNLFHILNDKYKEVIYDMTVSVHDGDSLKLNTVKLFYHLFRSTFLDSASCELIKNSFSIKNKEES